MGKYTLGDIFQGDFGVTQSFENDPAYYKQFGLAGHEGVDFATPYGTPILAPFDGIILRQDYQNDYRNYGKVVVVWDPVQKCAVWFCHLSEEGVNNGDKVSRGKVLGKTGNTGNVVPKPSIFNPKAGSHLHFNFCETDGYANRMNTNNGFLGFINSLNPDIVNWQMLSSQPPESLEQKVARIKALRPVSDINDTDKLNQIWRILGV